MTWIKEAADKGRTEKVIELLNQLDGWGIVFEDEDMVRNRIKEMGLDWLFGK